MDKRSEPRFKLRIPCELQIDGKRYEGQLVDVSAQGLSVLTDATAEQGTMVRVEFDDSRHGRIQVEALAWHGRNVAGGDARRLGLVLVQASDAYERLVGGGDTRAAPETPRPAPPEPRATVPTAPAQPCYRVRAGQIAGSRTRTLVVAADSSEAAETLALDELGDDWKVIEVRTD